MKIELKHKGTTFEELEGGCMFEHCGDLYQKLDDTSGSRCSHCVVSCKDGKPMHFSQGKTTVREVFGTFIED